MTESKLQCPSCGSTKIDSLSEQRQMRLPFAAAFSYPAVVNHCLDCDFAGDFANANEGQLALALDGAKKASVGMMLSQLTEIHGQSMAGMERALELPARTMMQWKASGCSAGALALMRVVTTYPWIVDVADAQFDPIYAKKRLIQEGVGALCRAAESGNINLKVDLITSTPYDALATVHLSRGIQPAFDVKETASTAFKVTK